MKLTSYIKKNVPSFSPKDLSPNSPFVVVGDLHGRADLLLEMEDKILQLAQGCPTVFVGDYIDRGPDSKDVLEMLASASETGDQPVITLMGNHEAMCLDFIDNPTGPAAQWLRHGGQKCLASYGVKTVSASSSYQALCDARDALVGAMGKHVLYWLKTRPLFWRSGNVWVTHAGADPTRPVTAQGSRNLLLGHPRFETTLRTDGQWVVSGHIVHRRAGHDGGRIWVDTGAYATGTLSAALIEKGALSFFRATVSDSCVAAAQ